MAETKEKTAPASDVTQEILDLKERITVLSGRLQAIQDGPNAIVDVQTHVDGVWQREQEKRRGGGDQEWYIHDKRKPALPARLFMTQATSNREAARDYEDRTGFRWLGTGESPLEFKRTPQKAEAKDK